MRVRKALNSAAAIKLNGIYLVKSGNGRAVGGVIIADIAPAWPISITAGYVAAHPIGRKDSRSYACIEPIRLH
jgi:hypothetical protein